MRRNIPTVLAALSAAALLAACSADDGDVEILDADDAATQAETGTEEAGAGSTEDAADTGAATDGAAATGAVSDDPICTGFFTATGNAQTLAERADTQRDAIDSDAVTDAVTYSEVTLLEGRIMALVDAEGEDAENAALLERVNAPFEEARMAVAEGDAQDEEGAISLPEIDVTDSQAAQDELEAACAG